MIDKELAARLSPESGDQWLNVWLEIGDEWCLPGVSGGTHTLISSSLTLTGGFECTLSKFADDTKRWGAVTHQRGRMPSRGI